MLAIILAFLKTKFGQYLIIGLAVSAILGFGVYKVHHDGFIKGAAQTEAKYKKIYDDELNRQLEIQDKVVNKQNQIISELQKSEDELTKKLKENAGESAKDPNNDKPALDSSRVLRIDRIK